jgi:hypothetical protein
MTHRRKMLCSTILTVGLLGFAARASATPSYTPVQTASYTFGGASNSYSMTGSTSLTFNGFDSTLGNLVGVDLELSLTGTLNNTAAVISGTSNATVGSPTPLSAFATTTVLGYSSLTSSITTPGFAGTVIFGSLNTVGTTTVTGQTTSSTLTGTPTTLSAYIGGADALTVYVLENGNQGGSVPGNVLSGNNGTVDVSLSVDYAYTNPSSSTPEPASMSVLGLAMVGMGVVRRRRKSN